MCFYYISTKCVVIGAFRALSVHKQLWPIVMFAVVVVVVDTV